MKHPLIYRSHPSGHTVGKVAASVASILTIAAVLFVGSRDWKTDRPLDQTLTDVSDIKNLLSFVETVSAESAPDAKAKSQANVTSVIEKVAMTPAQIGTAPMETTIPGLYRVQTASR